MSGDGSEKSKFESIKESSRGLRGDLAEELREATDHFPKASTDLLKFHGVYQQDDRDERRDRQRQKLGRLYSCMVRLKNPAGGEISPEQWAALAAVAGRYGNGTLRFTSRQTCQFHGVRKEGLRAAFRLLSEAGLTTYGACGDGTRNTTACPVSDVAADSRFDGVALAHEIAGRFAFRSTAYRDIWLLDGEAEDAVEVEPLYGAAYLPRKFKIGVATPEHDCADAATNDVALFAVHVEGKLAGFDVWVGGGMGCTHGNASTYPRLATPLAFVEPEGLMRVLTALLELFRDEGNRADRKQARLKYLVDGWGTDRVRDEVASRAERPLEAARSASRAEAHLHLGWEKQAARERWLLGLFVENGRVADGEERRLLTGLGEVIRRFRPGVRLSPRQDIILTGIRSADRSAVERCLDDHGVGLADSVSPLRRQTIACPALPTCALALTEAERFLPRLIDELEAAGHGARALDLRMTGCPNSCVRTPVAELGLIGRSTSGYSIYVGGGRDRGRLAVLYADDVPADRLAGEVGGLLRLWGERGSAGESFGDFAARVGVEALREATGTTSARGTPVWPSDPGTAR